MKRKITSKLTEWKAVPSHKPLVLTWCRQIGKTHSIKEFGRDNYSDTIYINFEEMPDRKSIFSGDLDHRTIIDRIEAIYKKLIDLDFDSLIFSL